MLRGSVPWATARPVFELGGPVNKNFKVIEWKRMRRAIALGVICFVLLMIVGYSWKKAEDIAELLLKPGVMPFLWYFGGITETGPFGFLAFVFDIVLYGVIFSALLTLKQYAADRKTRRGGAER
jgi:hypothetical protein